MSYLSDCIDNWIPEIQECPDACHYQYAIVSNNEKLKGYLSYVIDWYASQACHFVLCSFAGDTMASYLIGKELLEHLDYIMEEYDLHRIEWRMIGSNPVKKHYDKYCLSHNGNILTLHDDVRDRNGAYHDTLIYEIIREQKKKGGYVHE
jgi:hypothetical protein